MADSLEYRTIFECFGSLVTAFKGDPVAIADELAAVALIPPPQDVADQKKSDLARRLAEDIRDRVKLSPSRYEDVVRVLSKHKWLEDIVRILQNTNEQLKVKDRQAVSTCVTAECDQSDGGKKLLSYRFSCDLGEIPHCESSLKVSNPVVSFASLDEDDLEDLQAQMSELTKEINLQFDKFFDAIFTSFRDSKQIDRDKVVVILTNKEAVFEKDELEGAKSMYDVFRMIKYHCSYFNYDVLTTMIQVHGSDRDKTYLEEYNKAFTEYCKAMPCAEGVYGNESSKSRRTKLKFKLDYELEQLKPNDVRSIKNNIARCLGIRPSSLYLCRVKEGCVLLEFLVPDFIVEKVFPLSDSQILGLYSEVKVLSVEHHALPFDIKSAALRLLAVTNSQATNNDLHHYMQQQQPLDVQPPLPNLNAPAQFITYPQLAASPPLVYADTTDIPISHTDSGYSGSMNSRESPTLLSDEYHGHLNPLYHLTTKSHLRRVNMQAPVYYRRSKSLSDLTQITELPETQTPAKTPAVGSSFRRGSLQSARSNLKTVKEKTNSDDTDDDGIVADVKVSSTSKAKSTPKETIVPQEKLAPQEKTFVETAQALSVVTDFPLQDSLCDVEVREILKNAPQRNIQKTPSSHSPIPNRRNDDTNLSYLSSSGISMTDSRMCRSTSPLSVASSSHSRRSPLPYETVVRKHNGIITETTEC